MKKFLLLPLVILISSCSVNFKVVCDLNPDIVELLQGNILVCEQVALAP